jgi:hypothetical protein
MSLELSIQLGAAIALGVAIVLVRARRRLGALNAASWLVILGALALATEHPQFAISFSVPFTGIADDLRTHPMPLLPHAQTHFFMAGVYALIGLVLLSTIARTLLREGRRAGWYAILFALLAGGAADLVTGALWFGHGSPLYRLLGGRVLGFGWEMLYVYFVAWIAALAISYQPIFGQVGENSLSEGNKLWTRS